MEAVVFKKMSFFFCYPILISEEIKHRSTFTAFHVLFRQLNLQANLIAFARCHVEKKLITLLFSISHWSTVTVACLWCVRYMSVYSYPDCIWDASPGHSDSAVNTVVVNDVIGTLFFTELRDLPYKLCLACFSCIQFAVCVHTQAAQNVCHRYQLLCLMEHHCCQS